MKFTIPELPQIGYCDDPRIFTLEEARRLLPLVWRITDSARRELDPVKERLGAMLPCDPRLKPVEIEYERIVRRWIGKMERLGLVVKGLWLADFDTGDGYLCWRFPERRLAYFHDYEEGFSGRRRLDEVIEELMPDWA
jgi:hypothetical protein